MQIVCPHCGASGQLDESKRPVGVDSVRCPRCSKDVPLPPASVATQAAPPPLRPCPDCGGIIEGTGQLCNTCETARTRNQSAPLANSGSATPPFPRPEGICTVCNGHFMQDDMVRFGSSLVCAGCKPTYVQMMSQGSSVPGMLQLAGFWIRLGAKMIDGIIFMIVLVVLIVAMVIFGKSANMAPEAAVAAFIFAYALIILGSIGYNIFFVGKYGATPGKMICNLKIVTPDGQPVTYGRATGRAFGELVTNMIPFSLGYLLMLFDKEKRTIHDMICNTRVIYK
jgi:predicted Zn finger-like uncharacterized protein